MHLRTPPSTLSQVTSPTTTMAYGPPDRPTFVMTPSPSSSAKSLDVTKPLLATDTGNPSGASFRSRGSPQTGQDEDDNRSPLRETSASLRTRTAATMLSFFILGVFTSTIGVVLPYLERYYHLTDIQVSVIFLAAPVGYVLAAQLNGLVHLRLGQRGIAVIGPLFQLLFAGGAAAHPPFPFLLVAVAAGNFGAGLIDASWCAWAAGRENANFISGLLHGSYSAGAAAGPFIAGTLLSAGRPWWHWYYVLVRTSLTTSFCRFANIDSLRLLGRSRAY
jgi:hypothetical protein